MLKDHIQVTEFLSQNDTIMQSNPVICYAIAVPQKTLTIANMRGLHARASARFVKHAEKFDAEVRVSKDGVSVAGTSIMGLMMLAAGIGTQIVVHTEGRQAHEALIDLAALVENKFHEE